MGTAQSTVLQPFESLVECRVEATSGETASKIWFNTPPITQELLDRLETIQLKTLSHNERSFKKEEDLEYSWFDLVIYRSWDRSKPRINLATKEELAWRSHCNVASTSEDGTQLEGEIFQRGHEMFKEIEAGDVIAVRVCSRFKRAVNYGIKGEIAVKFKDESESVVHSWLTSIDTFSLRSCANRSNNVHRLSLLLCWSMLCSQHRPFDYVQDLVFDASARQEHY
jgi:hypothetical protein